LEIRARISLEIAKFKANAKAVGSSFKTMGSGAEKYSKNVDKYIQRNLNNRLNAIETIKRAEQRALQFSAGVTQPKKSQVPAKSGSTDMVFGQGDVVQKATFKRALEYTSKITAAERKATAVRVSLAQKESKEKSAAEQKRYSNWLKINSAQGRASAKSSKNLKQAQLVDYFKTEEFDRKLASTRYAMYDIGRRALVFGTAVASGFIMAAKAAVDFESAFTSVERTTEVSLSSNIPEVRQQAQNLRDTLVKMSTEIPVAFADIAEIATLGAQLGLAVDDIDEFTESVAKFSAISGIAVDTVALSFGRLAELMDVPASQFENLSSAIAFTGINAVATDAEILKMAESISAATSVAGLAADETIGLASALASLKVRPQAARGVLTRLFRNFDLAVSESGAKLDDLGRLIGLTSLESTKLWNQDPSQFFQSFIEGAKATGELNRTLKILGVTNVRELDVIQRLSANMPVLTSALSDSKEQFELGTYASEAYALVVDDIASKITTMQNAVAALGASFGEVLLPILGFVVDRLKALATMLAESPKAAKYLVGALVALVAGASLFFASVAFGIAGLLAMKLAFDNLSGGTVKAGLSLATLKALMISIIPVQAGVTTTAGAVGFAFNSMTTAIFGARAATTAFKASLGILGVALLAAGAIWAFVDGLANAKEKAEEVSKATFEAAGGIEAFVDASNKGIKDGSTVYGEITGSISEMTEEQEKAVQASIDEERAALAAKVARLSLNQATEDGKKDYEDALAALKLFNDEIQRGKDLTEDSTIVFTEHTKQILANALANIQPRDGGEAFNLYDALQTEVTPEMERAFEAAGYDIVDVLDKAMMQSMAGLDPNNYLDQVFSRVAAEGVFSAIGNPGYWAPIIDKMYDAANVFNILHAEAQGSANEKGIMAKLLGPEADREQAIQDMDEFNDDIRRTVALLTGTELSENKVSDALDSFAQSAVGTKGELNGMGEAAKINMKNFASFMDEATEASILASEGTGGAFGRIVSGLMAMDAAGMDTSDAFDVLSENMIDKMFIISGNNEALREKLGQAVDFTEARKSVVDYYEGLLKTTVMTLSTAIAVHAQYMAVLAEFGDYEFKINLSGLGSSTEKALTPLEKLLAMLEALFKPSNAKLGALNAVSSLGEALKENGKVFTDWTDAGIDNISTMEDTILSLAKSSDGNTQVFANSLGALRAALVQVGVSGAGLKQIDQAIKENGKSAKVSKNQTKQFYSQLQNSGDAKRALLEIADAISAVQSAISAGLSATFAQGRAIDSVTLGWLDLTDAQDGARESIESANDAIVEANQSIQEAKDSINELTADSGKLEYQLQIAIKYGDTLRADAIRAQLDTIDTEIAGKEKDITDANKAVLASQEEIAEANSKLGINSTTRDIIEQNRVLQDMAGKYGDVAAFMITTAKPGADLTAIIDKQVEAFKQNAIQMGYTQTEAQAVADVLRTELIASMDEIPDNIRTIIEAETDAALTKVQKFAKDANARLASIKSKTITVTTIEKTVQANSGGSFKGWVRGSVEAATGGLITGPGTGTSDSISARLSNGEFVVKSAAVKHYGPDFFNSLNQMQTPSASMRMGSVAAATSNTVYLSTEDRQLLRSAIDRPVALYTDNTIIAKSANAGNTLLAQRGIR